jgi:hypothetical protein
MIYGVGLPRTATRSLEEALNLLGFSGSHFCILTGGESHRKSHHNFRIDNSLYEIFEALENFEINTQDLYILTDRDLESWKESIKKWPYSGPPLDEYKKRMIGKFKNYPNNFLIFNVKEGWEPLCNFLGEEVPTKSFPKIN